LTIGGSRAVAPLASALATVAAPQSVVDLTGNADAFARLCAGTTQLVFSTRAITADELTACQNAGINPGELLVAHYPVAVVVSASTADLPQCLAVADVNRLFAPSAAGATTNWRQLAPTNPDRALKVYAPGTDTFTFTIFDRLVEGEGLRADVLVAPTDADVLTLVAGDTGAAGVMSLRGALNAADRVRVVQLNTGAGCLQPTAETIEAGTYSASERILLYFNRAGVDAVRPFLDFVVSDPAVAVIDGAGFLAPSLTTLTSNRTVLSGGAVATIQPVGNQAAFIIPPSVAGAVTIAGSANLFPFIQDVNTALTAQYPGLTATATVGGDVNGVRRFCNGEINVLLADEALTPEQQANCAANGITPLTLDMGAQVVVLVINATDWQSALAVQATWSADATNTSGQLTATASAMPTSTSTPTLDPSATATATASATPTLDPTLPSPTPTATLTATASNTPTITPTVPAPPAATTAPVACLTTQQLNTVWGVGSTGNVNRWNQVDPAFPDVPITLFAGANDSISDLLMARVGGGVNPIRPDTAPPSNDPVFRAAAVANVTASLTYMTWADYQRVAATSQQRVQLVAVNAGSGCVLPSDATIADGTYTLQRKGLVLVNQVALNNVTVQSYVWFLLGDSNFGLLVANGFSGLTLTDWNARRETVLQAITAAQAFAAGTATATAQGTFVPTRTPTNTPLPVTATLTPAPVTATGTAAPATATP
jgi:phosphate transport system substrate-binding protein